MPNANLVKNIGFGPESTHTKEGERAATLVAQELPFPLRHPNSLQAHGAADRFTYYVQHRQARYTALIPAYQFIDWASPGLKKLKRAFLGDSRRSLPDLGDASAAVRDADGRAPLRGRIKRWLTQVRTPIVRKLVQGFLGRRRRRTEQARYGRWMAAGRPVPPPPYYKQAVVRAAGRQFGISVLVETGTYEGQMVEAVARDFRRIFTIELDAALSARAVALFTSRPHVTVLQGDTKEMLPIVLKSLSEPAVFWLDAHCSGGPTAGDANESPIMHELRSISDHPHHREHVILIDDAREFIGGAYPPLTAVADWARSAGYDRMQVQDDIIQIYRSLKGS